MYNLKTFSILFALPFILFSCTKEFTSSISGPRISKIKTNGKLSTEYIYDANNYVQKSISYDTLGKILSSTTNEYLNGKIYKKIYSNSPYYSLFDYNKYGLIEKASTIQTANDSLTNFTTYIYDENRQCKQINSYFSNDTIPYTYILNEYTGSNRTSSKCYTINYSQNTGISSLLNFTLYNNYDNMIYFGVNQSDLTLTPNLNNNIETTSPDIIQKGGIAGLNGYVSFTASSNHNNKNRNIRYSIYIGKVIYQYNADKFPVRATYPDRVVEYEYVQ